MKRHNCNYTTPTADALVSIEDLGRKDYRWIQRALGIAYTSQHAIPMGAIAVAGGSILGHAVNKFRNTPRVADWQHCSLHAEAALVDRVDVRGATVYVARVRADGEAGMAKPCRFCLPMLLEAGARKVVWTDDDGLVGQLSLNQRLLLAA